MHQAPRPGARAIAAPALHPGSAWWSVPLQLPYWWLALTVVSALDLLLTHLVLSVGGYEANPVAQWVLGQAGFDGMVVFKFAVMTTVVLIAEFIANQDRGTARRLAVTSLGISGFPVVWSTLLIAELILAN